MVGAVSIVTNVFLVRATNKQASAATVESQASQDLIEETWRDRALAHQPFLTFESNRRNPLAEVEESMSRAQALYPGLGRLQVRVAPLVHRVKNIGKGLATDCQYFGYFSAQREDGCVGPHQRFMITQQFDHVDFLDATIATVSAEIATRVRTEEGAIAHLDTIPGVGRHVAEASLPRWGLT